MKRGKKGRRTIKQRNSTSYRPTSYVLFLAVGAFVFLLAACEGGDPTTVGGCVGADLDAPVLSQPSDGGTVAWDPGFQWTAAKSDNEPDIDVEKHVVEIFWGTACSGTVERTSGDLGAEATSYKLGDFLDPSTTYAWHVEATFTSTTDQTTCIKKSGCRIFTTTATQ